jgi:hypothetical protein
MTVIERMNEAETALFEGLAGLHERVIDVNKSAAEGLVGLRPEAMVLPELPEPVLTPADSVKRYFDFSAKLLEANRSFTEQIVAAWTPAVKPAAKAAAKSK